MTVVLNKLFWILPAVWLFALTGHAAPPKSLPPITWQFDTSGDKDFAPRTNVFLCINDHLSLLVNANKTIQVTGRPNLVLRAAEPFRVIRRQEYKERKVPTSALTACAGEFGGAGDSLYVIRRNHALWV